MTDPGNGAYSRRRIDELLDQRTTLIEHKVDELDRKLDTLSGRLAWAAGALAIAMLLFQVLGPVIVQFLLGDAQ